MDACPDDDTLSALLAGELAPAAREAVAVHAAGCAACHAVVSATPGRADDEAAGAGVAADSAAPTGGGAGEARDALELHPGARVGRYVIEERRGAGGMATVHAARDLELERRVALKLLRGGSGDRAARERLVREARALARLAHPNVVTVFEVGEHRGHLFVAMELVDGGDLTAWMAARPRTADAVLACMIEAGRGLDAAHRAGIVHRDVKPANILVGRDGRVRVTDFGLARVAPGDDVHARLAAADLARSTEAAGGDLTRTGTVLGTPLYMAPEVLDGRADARSDQWAFCATLHELVAGVRPFPSEPTARAAAIADGRVNPPAPGRRVPARLRRLIARGLRAEPSARWPDLAAVVAELVRVRQRRRRAATVAIAAAIVAVAAIAVRASPRAPARPPPEPATFVDMRPGCGCPFSACADGCLSVCSARSFRRGAAVPGVSVPGRQEALQGASADGELLLYLAGEACAIDHLWLARRHGWMYVPVDLTDQVHALGLRLFEGCCSLTADGRKLVLISADRRRVVIAALDRDRIGPPAEVLAPALRPAAGAVMLVAPVLAHDELTLYFSVEHRTPDGDLGDLSGPYLATRDDAASPFGPGRRTPGTVRNFEYVSGISRDGLTLFMSREFQTHVLVRARPDQWFGGPSVSVPSAPLLGWHAVPLGDCRRVVTTWSPGGCHQEQIHFLDAD